MIDPELKHLLDEMRRENAEAHAETRSQVDRGIDALRLENAAAHTETRSHADRGIDALRLENAAAHVETRRHFAVLTEATFDELRLIGEAVKVVNQKLDRTAASLDEKIEHSAGETRKLIRFGYDKLDRRVRKLEAKRRAVK